MRGVKKNTKKIIASIFVSVLVFQGAFAFVGSVYAQSQSQVRAVDNQIEANQNAAAAATPTVTSGETIDTGCGLTNIGGCLRQMFIWLLLQIRNFVYLIIASPAAAAFVWAVDPANVSGPRGVLNLPAVYQLWQFIRDFFNLFFILILLFSAFATIFQVDSFNIRNIFKNVLLVALLINFSFPITRFLIDATNVPMYYFINDVIGNGTGRGGMIAMNNMLASSGISAGTMTTTGENNNIVPVLMSIVFAFIFGISLAVLAVMMIIRLVALTLLLIFSPIGFAGVLLPGFSRYGNDWWSNFWKYALFGPTAALMLVVSLKFLEASGSLFRSMQMVGTDITPGTGEATLVSQVIFFTIPIMLIWFTIGLADKMAIAGAATVVGLGKWAPNKIRDYSKKAMISTAKFTGRTAVNTTKAVANRTPVLRSVPGAYAGVKEAFKGDGKLFGKQIIPKFATGDAAQARKDAIENRRRTAQGFVQGGRKGADDELRKLESERVKKGIKEAQEKGTTPEKHLKTLKEGSSVEKRIAALSLAQQGEIRTAGQLADALDAVKGNVDEFNQVLDKAKPEAIGSMGAAENDRINKALNERNKDGTSIFGTRQGDLQQAYNGRLKKENKIEYRIDSELERAVSSGSGPVNPMKVYADNLKMATKDLAKQSGIIQRAKDGGTDPNARQYFQEMARTQNDSFEKLLASDELKTEDRQVLIEIKSSVAGQAQQNAPRSQAWQNAQAAFNQPTGNAGQNNGGQQNP